jgi:hypothetical protein
MTAPKRHLNRATLLLTIAIVLGLVAVLLPISEANLLSRETTQPIVVAQNPPTGTYFDHLVFIMMENNGISAICGSNLPPPCDGSTNNTPYMASLANSYGIETQYVDLAGSSQPNYIGIMAATLNGCSSGCGVNSLTEVNLVDRFDAAGLSWKAYMEDQTPAAGCDTADHGFYEVIHNPFLAFHDIETNATRCNNVVLPNPSSCPTGANGFASDCALVNDLNSSNAPNFSWLTPNDCNNMHGNNGCSDGCHSSYTTPCDVAGDNYLKTVVPSILGSNTFKNTRAALFITFDEGSGFCPSPNPGNADCMYTVWAGPTTKTNFTSNNADTHYFFTKTIESNWGLATMTSKDAAATAMTEFFSAPSPDFSISANPSSITALKGATSNSTITLNSLNSFTGTVTLTASSSPTGPTLTLNPTSVSLTSGGTGTSTLSITSSTTGNYTVTVTGTSGALQHTTSVTDQVQDYTITSNPTSIKTNKGTSGTSTITITPINHFSGTVSLSVTGTSGLTTGISPTTITGGSGTSTLTASSTTTSNYTATITSSSGSLTHTTTVTVQVVDYAIAATSPSPVNIGVSATSTITISSVNHFSGTVTLTDTVPTGLTCGAISPGSITGSGTASVSCHASTQGNYTLTITGTSGSLVHSTTTVFRVQDYNITANPTSVSVDAGSPATSMISVTALNGFASIISLTTNSTSCTISPTSLTGSGSSTLSCTFASTGTVHVTVTGTSGSLSHSATVTFTVQDFTIAAVPTSVNVNNGNPATSNITITGLDGFSDTVNLSTNSTSFCTVSPSNITGSGSAALSCTFNTIGNKHILVTGTSSPLSHSVIVTFVVQDYSIIANPASVNVNTGSAGTSTITVSALNGFAGIVTLATNSTSCSVSPTSVTGSGSVSLSCTFTSTGTFHVGVTGTSTNLSHSTTVTFVVQDFTVSASPTSVTANAGSAGTSSITVTGLNGFGGIVSLATNSTSCAVSPTSVTGSGASALSCTFASAGTIHVGVTGTSASLSHAVTITFVVQDYTVTASPSGLNVNVNASGSASITITSVNGFAGVVSLATNTTSFCSVTPTSVTGSGSSTLSCTFTSTGTKHVSVTGTSTSLSHSVTVAFAVQDFAMTANPTSVNANVNATGTSAITVAAVNGFAGVISLSTNSTSCGLAPTSVTGSGTSNLSCSYASTGTIHILITGTSGSLTHSVIVAFNVQDFTIAANPSSASLIVNTAGTSTITVGAVNQFAGVVSLITNTTSSCNLSPASVTGAGSSTLSCTFTSTGNKHVLVTGTSGLLSHSVIVTFVVQDFTITANPASVNVNVNAAASSTIAVTAVNGFAGIVTLSTNSTLCSLSPTIVTSSGSSTLTCTFTSATTNHVGVTGTSGTLSHSTTVTFVVQDFLLTAAPASVNVKVNSSGTSTVTLSPVNGFNSLVNLVTNSTSCSLTPTSLTGSGSATLSCSYPSAQKLDVRVTGTSGSLTHTADVVFKIQDFTLGASPTSVTVKAGTTGTSTITLTSLQGFTGTVTLANTVSPSTGLTCTLSPTSIVLGTSGTSTLSCSGSAGAYTVTVNGTSGTLSHSANVTLTVQDFTLTANPTSLSVNAGSPGTSNQTVTALDGFSGTVSLATNSTFCTISPSSLAGSGSATLSCSFSTASTFHVNVTGTSASLSHSLTVTYIVRDFALTSVPATVTANAGSAGTSTITVSALNGFSGIVSLATNSTSFCTLSPASITASGSSTLSCTITIAGTVHIGITGTSASLSHTLTVSYVVQDFNISATPTTVTVLAGSTGTSTLTIGALNGFNSIVVLGSNSTLCTLSPSSVTGPSSSTLSCNFPSARISHVTVTGTSSTLSHNTTITFTVQDYTIAASSPAETSVQTSISSTVTITGLSGFTGTVNLTDTVPSGLACGPITPNSLAGSGTATVSCNSTTAGNYTLTVTGSSTTLAHSTAVVFMFGDFNISATSSGPVDVNGPSSVIMTVASVNHFGGTVSLMDTMPLGLFCGTISPMSLTGSGTASLGCTSASSGNYTIQIRGTAGSLVHTTNLMIRVTDFAVSASPTLLRSPVGTNATSTITLASLNGFSGTVNATATVQSQIPSGGGGFGGRGSGGRSLAMAPPSLMPDPIVNPSSLIITSQGTGQYTLTIILPAGTLSGNYTIIVTATDGTVSHTTQLMVAVADFSLSTTNSTVTISPGGNSTLTLNLQSLNGFQANLNLSTAISPSGPTASANPSSLFLSSSSSSLLTITVPPSTTIGNYTLTIQAGTGTLSHTVIITITVRSASTSILARVLESKELATTGIAGLLVFASLFSMHTLRTRKRTIHERSKRSSKRIAFRDPTQTISRPRVIVIGPFGVLPRFSD